MVYYSVSGPLRDFSGADIPIIISNIFIKLLKFYLINLNFYQKRSPGTAHKA